MRFTGGQRGFSLIELVITIVIASILSVGVAVLITGTADGYIQTSSRNQLAVAARSAVDRIALEVHDALPNSIRTSAVAPDGSQCLEYVPVLAATVYRDPAFRPSAPVSSFEVVGFSPSLDGLSGVFAVIYPHNASAVHDPASLQPDATGALAAVNLVSDIGGDLSRLDTVSHRFARRSPQERLYLVSGPVSFCVDGDALFRYEGYGFQNAQPTIASLPASTATGRWLVSDSLDNAGLTAFRYVNPGRLRNGILQLQVNVSDRGESVLLDHEVMLQNVP